MRSLSANECRVATRASPAGRAKIFPFLLIFERFYGIILLDFRRIVAPFLLLASCELFYLTKALTKLGYYEPDTRAGESKKQLNQYPNQRLFNAIDKFRTENKIKETGAVKPGHWTEVKIKEELKQQQEPYRYKGNTFETKIDVKDGQYAVFDGQKLTVYDGDNTILFWNAVSGKDGFQTPEYQDQKNKGPIPKGVYIARQEKIQHMSPLDWAIGWTRVFGDNLGGKWPGSSVSWGTSRVWLEPSKETNTFGRDKFSIHGGTFPGSAGCIDLTNQINSFTSWLENTGKDLLLYVKYE